MSEIEIKESEIPEEEKIEDSTEEEPSEESNEVVIGDIILDDDSDNMEEDTPSDFSIADTILSTDEVLSWHGQNLEETISREQIEKNWGDETEPIGTGIYNAGSSNNLYETGSGNGSSLYNEVKSGQDLYNEQGGQDLYNSGENGPSGNNNYNTQNNVKSYGELEDQRRSGRSMLEIAGFEDKEKQKQRDMRSNVRYEGMQN